MLITKTDVINILPVKIDCRKIIFPNIYYFNYNYISGYYASYKVETVYIILMIIKALAGITMLLKFIILPTSYNIRYRLHTLFIENDISNIKINGTTMVITSTFSVCSDAYITSLILSEFIGVSI